MKKITICCISDTHSLHDQIEIPKSDILVHAGDFTCDGKEDEIVDFNRWLGEIKDKGLADEIIVIAGNHDKFLEKDPKKAEALLTNCIYLRDRTCLVKGLSIFGSPWQPWFCGWAFNVPRLLMDKKWELIPKDTDILITHGPAQGYGGMTSRGEEAGCEYLRQRLLDIKPLAHICGHIHEDRGVYHNGYTQIINASICTLQYEPTNPPIVIEIEK